MTINRMQLDSLVDNHIQRWAPAGYRMLSQSSDGVRLEWNPRGRATECTLGINVEKRTVEIRSCTKITPQVS